jgi:hypothetical protein
MATRPKGYLTKGKTKTPDAFRKAAARKELSSLKGIAGLVGRSVVEGIGGPKARAAKVVAKTSAKVARAVANEAAGKKAKAPFGIYRKPSAKRTPRLRDTDNTTRKTIVRQQVGPKTKSGKFVEPKRKAKVNTQPPATTKPRTTAREKFDPTAPVTYKRGLPVNPRLARVERTRRAKRNAEYKEIRARLEKKAKARNDSDAPELRPKQPTIESRLESGAEKLDMTSRNVSKPSGMSSLEWRRYAEVARGIAATEKGKPVRVPREVIARGRARALTPTSERRAAVIKATQQRAIAKAKARGMTDAQINQMIAKARAEAARIAKKAAK